MDKLTIEHLAAYLPYEIMCKYCVAQGTVWKLDITNIKAFTEIDKLILRPLSDLTNEIQHNGEKFVPIVELLKIKHKGWFDAKIGTRYSEIEFELTPNYAKSWFSFHAINSINVWMSDINHEEYWVVKKLLSWHFDVFGLIPKGLAIDKKEVQNDNV